MIIRHALKCETCEHPHTVRIGMGQESSQTHKFPCCGCSEDIVVRLDVDYDNTACTVVCVENCGEIDEVAGAPVVNVDANFLIPPDAQGIDGAFPRLEQLLAMFKAAQQAVSHIDKGSVQPPI